MHFAARFLLLIAAFIIAPRHVSAQQQPRNAEFAALRPRTM
jgi:hypothetical protein